MHYALSDTEEVKRHTHFKLITLLPEERVIGLHIVSKYADEML